MPVTLTPVTRISALTDLPRRSTRLPAAVSFAWIVAVWLPAIEKNGFAAHTTGRAVRLAEPLAPSAGLRYWSVPAHG